VIQILGKGPPMEKPPKPDHPKKPFRWKLWLPWVLVVGYLLFLEFYPNYYLTEKVDWIALGFPSQVIPYEAPHFVHLRENGVDFTTKDGEKVHFNGTYQIQYAPKPAKPSAKQ
jgi:magnesium-transporting ATPase (P-type)